jgi:ERCC4-type nuclease
MSDKKNKDDRHIIIRDTREKSSRWEFVPDHFISGVEDAALKTGDYSIKGYEDILTIERKRNTSEVCTNLFHYKDRIYNEFERMKAFKYPFVIFEFTLENLLSYPYDSGLSRRMQSYMKINGPSLMKRVIETSFDFPHVHFIYAGKNGKQFCLSLMKRVVEREEKCKKNIML